MSKHVIPGFPLSPPTGGREAEADFRLLRRLPQIGEIATGQAHRPVRLGIIDTETTGLDPTTNELIEVAISMMTISADGGLHHIEEPVCWLEQPSLPLEPRIIQVTGLTDDDLAGQQFDDHDIADMLWRCDVLVSHNARFDRAFLARRFGGLIDKPWGCTATDIDWLSHGLGGRSLGHLLYEAGYFFDAHRAGPDSWALACLLAGQASDGRTYAAHLTDAVRMISHRIYARRAPYQVKDRLKARGYRWDANERCWWIDLHPEAAGAECGWLLELNAQISPEERRITAYERYE
ncbi:MAG: DNA polymerase III subunit epsilon [Sphingomonas sp.]|nr:DNA polymerase III subunit epsilon [Sphingomonas sp.]